MTESWRLIIDGPAEGAMNMALDRAVQRARDAGDSPATVRLYRWERPTASLGRFQKLQTVDLDACRADGIDVVRRPTGGRGVLHDAEVTYSIVAGVDDGVPRGTSASYRMLCSALVATYRKLGIDASLTARRRGSSSTGACYLLATEADLSLGAAKLSGSAQVWQHETVLQHGSFVIARDVAREARVFRLNTAAALELAEHTCTLEQALGAPPFIDDVIAGAVEGIAEGLGVRLECGEYSAFELETAEELVDDARVATVTPSR